MPLLSRVAGALGVPFFPLGGREIRATVRPPPPAGPGFEGALTPRSTIIVNSQSSLPTAGVIRDGHGTRFLHARWGREGVLGSATAEAHVLFAVTGDEAWTRNTFTTEIISGQRVAGALQSLGTVPVVREFVRRKNDALDVEEEVYRVLCLAALLVGDFLGGRRVTRTEGVLGLVHAEVF